MIETTNEVRYPTRVAVPRVRVPPRRRAIQQSVLALLRGAEWSFAVVGLVIFSGAVLPLVGSGGFAGEVVGGTATEDNGITQPVFRLMYAATALLLLLRPLGFVRAAARQPWIWALLGLTLVSTLWSVAPDQTTERGVRLLAASLFALSLVVQRDQRDLLHVCAWAFGLIALLSVAFAVAIPAYGISPAPHAGAWRGVYAHKNTLGSVMTLGTLVFVLLARTTTRRAWALWAGAALSAMLVLLSRSATALVVLATLLALIPLLGTLRWHPTRTIAMAIFGVLIAGGTALGLLANAERVLALLGKDLTLTGRTELWAAVLEMIRERPLLGYGYRAVWAEGSIVRQTLGWFSVDAHNGYLDLILDVGLLGLAIFVAAVAATVARGVLAVRSTDRADGSWILLITSFLLLQNISETSILYPRSMLWLLFVATICSVYSPATEEDDEAAEGAAPQRPTAAGGAR